MKDTIVFFDKYSKDADMLMESIGLSDEDGKGVLVKDELYKTKEYSTIYDYFLRKNDSSVWERKDIFFIFIEVPKYWEVRTGETREGFIGKGVVVDNGKIKGRISFKKPVDKKMVESVEWFREDGTVYRKDIYNEYGFVYCKEYFGEDGKEVTKSYFTSCGKEIININLTNGCVSLNENNKALRLFGSIEEFEDFAVNEIRSGKLSVYTSVKLIEKQMKYGVDKDTAIVLWKADEIIKCKEEGIHIKFDCPLYMICKDNNIYESNNERKEYVAKYTKESYMDIKAKGEFLIYTWHDQLIGIESLVKNFPEATFHIAAKTAVSNKLKEMSLNSNVHVHEAINDEGICDLYDKCDIYLDINMGEEVDDAIINAHRNGMLIMGYDICLHNRAYMLEEHIFKSEEGEMFESQLKTYLNNKEKLAEVVNRQQEYVSKCAISMR